MAKKEPGTRWGLGASAAIWMLRYVHRVWLLLERRLYKILVVAQVACYAEPLRVNGYSRVTANTYLGANVNMNGLRVRGRGKLTIGDNFHSGTGCLIITEVHNYNDGSALPYDETYIVKDVVIEDNVWLGSNVIILGGTWLGEGSIVQAGAVVVSDVPPCAIVGGNPARVFKHRDMEHYRQLKAQGRYF